mmetsp:Transcript_57385/g.136395  ORF Transcript_57385/g.136395 Transcript_57385/m.136395 type:complete len:456 (-) Transcript_57385:27-1394(-)
MRQVGRWREAWRLALQPKCMQVADWCLASLVALLAVVVVATSSSARGLEAIAAGTLLAVSLLHIALLASQAALLRRSAAKSAVANLTGACPATCGCAADSLTCLRPHPVQEVFSDASSTLKLELAQVREREQAWCEEELMLRKAARLKTACLIRLAARLSLAEKADRGRTSSLPQQELPHKDEGLEKSDTDDTASSPTVVSAQTRLKPPAEAAVGASDTSKDEMVAKIHRLAADNPKLGEALRARLKKDAAQTVEGKVMVGAPIPAAKEESATSLKDKISSRIAQLEEANQALQMELEQSQLLASCRASTVAELSQVREERDNLQLHLSKLTSELRCLRQQTVDTTLKAPSLSVHWSASGGGQPSDASDAGGGGVERLRQSMSGRHVDLTIEPAPEDWRVWLQVAVRQGRSVSTEPCLLRLDSRGTDSDALDVQADAQPYLGLVWPQLPASNSSQ